MANAVSFWKGSATAFASKTYVDGRIYFVTDDDNLGSLYLGVAEGEAVKAVMISPKRLTALSLDTTDDKSSVTAKAVVDFVKANFDAKGAYDQAISDINAAIDLKADKATYEAKVEEIEGRLDATEGVANGAAAAVATKVEQSEYEAKVKELDEAIKAITGEGEEGDATTIAGLAVKVSTLEGEMDSAEGRLDAIEGQLDGITGTVKDALDLKADASSVYTKGEADELLSGKVDNSTYNGKISSIEGRLDATEGVANGAAAAVATKVEQSAYDTKMGEVDAALADRYTKKEADDLLALKANAADVYTKEEVGNMLSAALEFKGTVEAYENLPATAETGDVYYVKKDQSEYVWVDATHKWEKLGPVVDYTQFAQASSVYTKDEIDGKVSTINGAIDAKVAQSDYNTKMGEVDAAIADRYTKEEVDSAISAAALVWVED